MAAAQNDFFVGPNPCLNNQQVFYLRQWHNLFTTKECSHSTTLRQQHMDNTTLQDKIDDATLDFTLGDALSALTKLNELATTHPDSFAIWHALTEVYFSESQYDEALTAAEKALKLAPEDIHIHTSLSRIWMERGDKKAEHHGAQARMLRKEVTLTREDKDSF